MTTAKSKHKIALLCSLALIALLAVAMAFGGLMGITSARATDDEYTGMDDGTGGRRTKAVDTGYFYMADSSPAEAGSNKPLNGYEIEDTRATEKFTFKYDSQGEEDRAQINMTGSEFHANADTLVENAPVWTLKVNLNTAKGGKFILPLYYVGEYYANSNKSWVLMSRLSSGSNMTGEPANSAHKTGGFMMLECDASRGSSDSSVVEWGAVKDQFINVKKAGTAYLFAHFWYSCSSGSSQWDNRPTVCRSKSLGDVVIKVVVTDDTENPMIENGTVYLEENKGTGYELTAVENQDYDYKLSLNSFLKNDYSFTVRYGTESKNVKLSSVADAGYGIAEGDYERDSTDKTVADWSGDAVNYTITVPERAMGETVVNCKVWVPAATDGLFGEITAKDETKLLGEFKVLVDVQYKDVNTYGRFSKIEFGGSFPSYVYLYGFTNDNAAADPGMGWDHVQRFQNSATDVFFENVLFNGVSLKELYANKDAQDAVIITVNFRNDHIEFYLKDGDPDGSDIRFKEGDSFEFKAGLMPLETIGSNQFRVYNTTSREYWILKADQKFVYRNAVWSDEYGLEKIELSDSVKAVDIGGTVELTASLVNPGEQFDKTVTWSIEDDTVATVTADETDSKVAVIKGLKKGSTKVIATAKDGQTAECTVSVVDPTEISSITREGAAARTVTAGVPVTLKVKVEGGTQADKTVTWTSSDDSIASVNNLGVVDGKKAGTVTVTASCGGKSVTFAVTVLGEATTQPGGDDNGSGSDDNGCGCGSSVASASAIGGAVLVLMGAVLLSVRRKSRQH